MVQIKQEKEISKADMKKKVEAYKTINAVLVQTNANFMNSLTAMLTEKQAQLSQLEEKAKNETATEEENATLLFLGGYVQCLKDILYAKKATQN
jgi:uncharacterized membrane protein YdfJ with MMPL/SSD domain